MLDRAFRLFWSRLPRSPTFEDSFSYILSRFLLLLKNEKGLVIGLLEGLDLRFYNESDYYQPKLAKEPALLPFES